MPDQKLIPIYDDAAAVACTITKAEIPERVSLLEGLRDAMTTIERTPTGLLLHFPDNAFVRDELSKFVVDEKRCCQFWGFAITDEADGVALRWDGPPAVDDVIDRLVAFFTGDAPLSLLDGLL